MVRKRVHILIYSFAYSLLCCQATSNERQAAHMFAYCQLGQVDAKWIRNMVAIISQEMNSKFKFKMLIVIHGLMLV